MTPSDCVYDQIFKQAIAAGATERNAKDHACAGVDDFKKNKFKKLTKMIAERIKAAAKMPK